jgi:putative ABC transport system substrate-binding protein
LKSLGRRSGDRAPRRYFAIREVAAAILVTLFLLNGRGMCADAAAARVGVVWVTSPKMEGRGTSDFWERLKELGWIKGKNLHVEERWAGGRLEQLPALMNDVVARGVDVIVTTSTPAAIAAKNATSTIPIVIFSVGDPVGVGLVSNLARPGGNLTGLSIQATEGLPSKWLELMREALPRVSTVAVIFNPDNPLGELQWQELLSAAAELNIKLRPLRVRKPDDFESVFKQAKAETQAVLVLADPMTFERRQRIVALAARYKLPGMYTMLEFADDGGLIAHGVDRAVLAGRAADYVDKILRGAKPGDLPIDQATKFSIVINLKTAKALHITMPESMLLRADELIR